MSRKSVIELQNDLAKLKERENKLKEELIQQQRRVDAKLQKERTKKIFMISEMLVRYLGEEILDNQDILEFFIADHLLELKEMLGTKN